MQTQDQINHTAWTQSAGVHWLTHLEGFTDAGERAAYEYVSRAIADGPILDLGVGGGRTVELLRELSPDYVGIDYEPVLVESAHHRYPNVDIRLGDARELAEFEDDHFALVVFSYMGIDSVNHGDRQRVLREVRRVLKPGGMFWFSTLNLRGAAARARPWHVHIPATPSALARASAVSKGLLHMPRSTLNYLRTLRGRDQGEGWQVAPFFAYSYGLLVHYTTLEHELTELETAGFQPNPAVFEDVRGAQVHLGEDLTNAVCFNVLAQK